MSEEGSLVASRALLAELTRKVRERGLVFWVDADGQYETFVDALGRAPLEFPYPVLGFRRSYLELMLALERYGSGLEPEHVLVHRKPLTRGLSAVRARWCEIQLMAKRIKSSGRARRPRRSAAEWRREVANWRASGLTAAAYAGPRGLHEGTLTGWASRLARSGIDPVVPKGTGRFMPVRVVAARSSEPEKEAPRLCAEVVLRGGRCVRLTGELRVDQLRHLLDAVEGGGRC